MYKAYEEGIYCVVEVSEDIFNKISDSYCITGSNSTTKYLLGNETEIQLMSELCVALDSLVFDYIKVIIME